MPINDLTGTKWIFNAGTIENYEPNEFFINFTSNNSSYTRFAYSDIGADDGIYYGSTRVAAWGDYVVTKGWIDQAYRIISITGGTDVTNSDLISYFETYATQVDVTDLTETVWQLKSNVYIEAQVSYAVNVSYSGYTFGSIDFIYYTADGKTWKGIKLDNSYSVIEITAIANPVDVDPSTDVLRITNGTDATNPDLIAWFTTNAVQQGAVSTGKTQIGNRAITKKMFGTREITKEVINGIVVYEKQVSGYNVTLTISNSSHVSSFGSITFYSNYTYSNDRVDLSSQDQIGTLSTATGTVTVETNNKFVMLAKADYIFGGSSIDQSTITGGVNITGTYAGFYDLSGIFINGSPSDVYVDNVRVGGSSDTLMIIAEVSGDGTITINSID